MDSFFEELGFTEYEGRTFSSLLKLKASGIKEISLNSGVPQNKLYGIIKKFENLGILSLVSVEPKKYQLINSKNFIKEKIKKKQERLKEMMQNLRNIRSYREDNFVFSLIKGQRAIMNKLVGLNKNARKEIFGVQRNWKYWGEGIREMEKAVKRDVDVRLIGIISKETKKRAGEWKNAGCKIKAYNKKFGEYPLRFSIFDGKYARITIGKPEIKESKDYITILTESKPLIRMLRNQFLQMWGECKKF